ILDPMYREIARYDKDGVLRHEWLNSRGAIARFQRNAIEIRLIDAQECPQADLAIAAAAVTAAKALYSERWSTLWQQQAVPTDALCQILMATMRTAEDAVIDDAQLLDVLGVKSRRLRAGEIWQHLIDTSANGGEEDGAWWRSRITFILEHGSLARRILEAVDGDFSRVRLR